MENFVLLVHILLCLGIVFLVLLQQGKGADAGVAFGGGSNSLFGAAGANNFVTKLTTGMAVAFFVTSIILVRTYAGIGASAEGGDRLQGSSIASELAKQAEAQRAAEAEKKAAEEKKVKEDGEKSAASDATKGQVVAEANKTPVSAGSEIKEQKEIQKASESVPPAVVDNQQKVAEVAPTAAAK